MQVTLMLSYWITYMLIVKRALLFFALHRPWQGKGGAFNSMVFFLGFLTTWYWCSSWRCCCCLWSTFSRRNAFVSCKKKNHLTHRNCCLGSLLKYLQLYTTGLCTLDTYILIVKKHYYCLLSTRISWMTSRWHIQHFLGLNTFYNSPLGQHADYISCNKYANRRPQTCQDIFCLCLFFQKQSSHCLWKHFILIMT